MLTPVGPNFKQSEKNKTLHLFYKKGRHFCCVQGIYIFLTSPAVISTAIPNLRKLDLELTFLFGLALKAPRNTKKVDCVTKSKILPFVDQKNRLMTNKQRISSLRMLENPINYHKHKSVSGDFLGHHSSLNLNHLT